MEELLFERGNDGHDGIVEPLVADDRFVFEILKVLGVVESFDHMSICEVSFIGFAKIVKDLSYRHKYLLCFVGRDDGIAEFDHMDPD